MECVKKNIKTEMSMVALPTWQWRRGGGRYINQQLTMDII
jgi:hypothetical protein